MEEGGRQSLRMLRRERGARAQAPTRVNLWSELELQGEGDCRRKDADLE